MFFGPGSIWVGWCTCCTVHPKTTVLLSPKIGGFYKTHGWLMTINWIQEMRYSKCRTEESGIPIFSPFTRESACILNVAMRKPGSPFTYPIYWRIRLQLGFLKPHIRLWYCNGVAKETRPCGQAKPHLNYRFGDLSRGRNAQHFGLKTIAEQVR